MKKHFLTKALFGVLSFTILGTTIVYQPLNVQAETSIHQFGDFEYEDDEEASSDWDEYLDDYYSEKRMFRGTLEGPEELTVYFGKEYDADGYELEYSTDEDFKKDIKHVDITDFSKGSITLTGLKGDTFYYVRMRPYLLINGIKYEKQVSYEEEGTYVPLGSWNCDDAESVVCYIEEKNNKTVKEMAGARLAYEKICTAAKENGYQVSILSRTTTPISVSVGAPKKPTKRLIWYTELCNNNYYYQIYIYATLYKSSKEKKKSIHYSYAYYIMDKNDNYIKDNVTPFHYPQTWKKGLLTDLKKYADNSTITHLNREDVKYRKGNVITIKMLNTNKKVKWSYRFGTKSEKKAFVLKKKTKDSITFTYNMNKIKGFHRFSFDIIGKVGNKKYKCNVSIPKK